MRLTIEEHEHRYELRVTNCDAGNDILSRRFHSRCTGSEIGKSVRNTVYGTKFVLNSDSELAKTHFQINDLDFSTEELEAYREVDSHVTDVHRILVDAEEIYLRTGNPVPVGTLVINNIKPYLADRSYQPELYIDGSFTLPENIFAISNLVILDPENICVKNWEVLATWVHEYTNVYLPGYAVAKLICLTPDNPKLWAILNHIKHVDDIILLEKSIFKPVISNYEVTRFTANLYSLANSLATAPCRVTDMDGDDAWLQYHTLVRNIRAYVVSAMNILDATTEGNFALGDNCCHIGAVSPKWAELEHVRELCTAGGCDTYFACVENGIMRILDELVRTRLTHVLLANMTPEELKMHTPKAVLDRIVESLQ